MNKNNEKRMDALWERLEIYRDAEPKILQGQSYAIGSRQLTRASLSSVQKMIKELETEIATLEQRGTTKRCMRRVVPLD